LISLLRALWQFEAAHNYSHPSDSKEDMVEFISLATRAHSDLGLPAHSLATEYIRAFLQNIDGELAPIAAIIGGTLSQEVINYLSGKEQPIQNTGLLDENGYGILSLQPVKEDDANGF
jgi:ubiquitin-like 1-activating enzyme E1 A